jgi:hypothetical protein
MVWSQNKFHKKGMTALFYLIKLTPTYPIIRGVKISTRTAIGGKCRTSIAKQEKL